MHTNTNTNTIGYVEYISRVGWVREVPTVLKRCLFNNNSN